MMTGMVTRGGAAALLALLSALSWASPLADQKIERLDAGCVYSKTRECMLCRGSNEEIPADDVCTRCSQSAAEKDDKCKLCVCKAYGLNAMTHVVLPWPGSSPPEEQSPEDQSSELCDTIVRHLLARDLGCFRTVSVIDGAFLEKDFVAALEAIVKSIQQRPPAAEPTHAKD